MIKAADIDGKVKAIIADKLGVDEKEITPQASFKNDLGADSLDTVELIMEFEKEFNLTIPDEEAEKISTVGQAIEYMKKNISERSRRTPSESPSDKPLKTKIA